MDAMPKFLHAHANALLLGVLGLFSLFTLNALWHHGYWGIVASLFQSAASLQVFVDLVIALVLVLLWMWADAKKTQRRFWPWLLLTLTTGSFGPLLYLLFRKKQE